MKKTLFILMMALTFGLYGCQVSADRVTKSSNDILSGSGKNSDNSVKSMSNTIGMKFVYIKPGTFLMGSNTGYPGEKPVHKVTLSKGFYMQTTEVTQSQWQAVMGNNPSYFKNCENCPVDTVSWDNAKEFINRLNSKEGITKYRLPTEAEWEYACRAGSNTDYANGNSLDQMGWYHINSRKKTHAVAQKKANNWGLFDMHGNVFEWCEDWYGKYPSHNVTDTMGPPTGVKRVFRGGSWYFDASHCRSASRDKNRPNYRYLKNGFRLVKEL